MDTFSYDITLAEAQKLSEKVRKKAAEMGVNAVVAVANSGGNPVLIECMDDSYIASYDVALKKAFTVVSLKMSTSDLKPLAQPGASLYGIQFTNDGKIIIFGGGEPLCGKDGKIIGGLGVSGGTEEQDTALAAYGKEIFEKGMN
ncbi:MAG: heme-binding protein [Clostridia bacterium]|nr:heme-binding protein [Clostridia bacterium]